MEANRNQGSDAVPVLHPLGLPDDLVGETRDAPTVRHVHRPDLTSIVRERVHDIDRKLVLVDATKYARPIVPDDRSSPVTETNLIEWDEGPALSAYG